MRGLINHGPTLVVQHTCPPNGHNVGSLVVRTFFLRKQNKPHTFRASTSAAMKAKAACVASAQVIF